MRTIFYRTYLLMNRLWKSDRSKSLTNSFLPLFSVPLAWFLNTTSSSHLRLISVSFVGIRSGLPRAMSFSRFSCSAAAFSSSSFSFCSALSLLIFSSSRSSSAVSSSSSSLSSSLVPSLSEASESASTSLVSSSIRRLFASRPSSSPFCPGPSSSWRLLDMVGSAILTAAGLVLEKCAASASRSWALRSRT